MFNTRNNDIGFVSNESIYNGFIKLSLLQVNQKMLNGETQLIKRELVSRRDCVSILPYDPATGNVLMLQQFRPGAYNDNHGAFVTELVAGVIDEHEDPIQAACREFSEETGLSCNQSNLFYLGRFYLSPGACNEQAHLYLAKLDLSIANTSISHGCKNEGEDIQLVLMHIDDAIEMSINQPPVNITLYAALLALKNSLISK